MKSASPISLRTRSRSSRNGEMNAVSTITPASTNSLAASPTRRTFSLRSASEKERSPHRPWRTLSPSSTKVRQPRKCNSSSTACASVDLPEPERPVNHSTQLAWPFCASRRRRVTVAWCHTMFGEMLFMDKLLRSKKLDQGVEYRRPGADGQKMRVAPVRLAIVQRLAVQFDHLAACRFQHALGRSGVPLHRRAEARIEVRAALCKHAELERIACEHRPVPRNGGDQFHGAHIGMGT